MMWTSPFQHSDWSTSYSHYFFKIFLTGREILILFEERVLQLVYIYKKKICLCVCLCVCVSVRVCVRFFAMAYSIDAKI